jgi:Uma2 family endonuclease
MSTVPQQIVDMTSLTVPIVPGAARLVDYMALPEGTPVELIKGELVVSPAPLYIHQAILIHLTELLAPVARAQGGKLAVAPTDVVLADDTVVQPDLVYLTKSRRHLLRQRIEGAPDLVIEIVSPSHARRDRVHKLALYAEHGVAEYWIVEPQDKVFQFMTLVDGNYQVEIPAGDTYKSTVVSSIELNLVKFWAEIDRMIAD